MIMKHVSLPDTAPIQNRQTFTSWLAALPPQRWNRQDRGLKPSIDAIAHGLGRVARQLLEQPEDEANKGAGVLDKNDTAATTTTAAPSPPPQETSPSTKVFLGAPLASCSLCDVGPGEAPLSPPQHTLQPAGSFFISKPYPFPTYNIYLPGPTADNIGGAGARTCRLSDTCDQNNGGNAKESQPPTADSDDDTTVWWNPPPGAGPANTSIAVLRLRVGMAAALSSPITRRRRHQRRRGQEGEEETGTSADSVSSDRGAIDPATVLVALQRVSRGLGLPQRYHARATKGGALDPLAILDGGEGGRASGVEEEDGAEEEDYLVFLVSDWRNVTARHVQRLRAPDTGGDGSMDVCIDTINT